MNTTIEKEIFENIIPNYIKLTPNDMKQLEKQMKQFYSDFNDLNKYVSDINKDNIDELLLFVERGNTLFLSDYYPPNKLLDTLNIEVDYVEYEKKTNKDMSPLAAFERE